MTEVGSSNSEVAECSSCGNEFIAIRPSSDRKTWGEIPCPTCGHTAMSFELKWTGERVPILGDGADLEAYDAEDPTYVDTEGTEWWWDGSAWNCWVAEQWVPAPGVKPTGLVPVVEEPRTLTCGNCGMDVLTSAPSCGSCGATLRTSEDQSADASPGVHGAREGAVASPAPNWLQGPDGQWYPPNGGRSDGASSIPPGAAEEHRSEVAGTTRPVDPFAWSRRLCPNGHVVEMGSPTCGECGVAASAAPGKRARAGGGQPVTKVSAIPQQKGRSHGLAITLGIVLVALVGGAIALVAAHSGGSGSTNQATFGVPCSQNPACSGSYAGGGGSTASGPTSGQLNQAYQEGYFYGQHLNGPVSFCQTSRYSDPQLNAQYQDGCGAGYSGGGSSSNNYGGIPGNQAPSPTTPDVQPYSGGSYSGSVDGSSGGFSGAP